MPHVTAVLEHQSDTQVTAAAAALARLLGVRTRSLRVPDGAGGRADLVVSALVGPDVVAGALSAQGRDPVCWNVITRVSRPVLVVPRRSERTLHSISKVLLPLDGSVETAAAVTPLARSALDSGAAVVAVHVFDPDTVPAFWDQAAHSHRHWTREFLRRNLPEPVELDLRRGRPAEEVLSEADASDADLIVIAWSQDLDGGRAATVRYALAEGLTPVLLLGRRPGPSPEGAGPSALLSGTPPA